MARHLAHFNWATLIDEIGTPAVAGFVDAIERVHSVAERSEGFVWHSGEEMALAQSIGWPMFRDPKVIASFSVWETPAQLEDFVYKTVHGAFYRRRDAWFVPDAARGNVLWWLDAGTIPDIGEARTRVETFLANGPGAEAFDFGWLKSQQTTA
jgi:hypothetical protein